MTMLHCNSMFPCQGQTESQNSFIKCPFTDHTRPCGCSNNNCMGHRSQEQTASVLAEDRSLQYDDSGLPSLHMRDQSPQWESQRPGEVQSSQWDGQRPQWDDQSPQWEDQSPYWDSQNSQSPPWGVRSPPWDMQSPQMEDKTSEYDTCSPWSIDQVTNRKWEVPSSHDDVNVSAHWEANLNDEFESPSQQWQGEANNPLGLMVTRQQVNQHNQQMGWQQWIILKGNVYHTTGFRDHFVAYNKKKAREAKKEASTVLHTPHADCGPAKHTGSLYHGTAGVTTLSPEGKIVTSDSHNAQWKSTIMTTNKDGHKHYTSDSDDSSEDEEVDNNFLWQYDVLAALRKSGLSMVEIENEIRPFKIGTLQDLTFPKWRYWDSIRSDVIGLCDELSNNESSEVGKYEQEYLQQLQRWLRRYMDMDPEEKRLGGDGNDSVFFLTQDPDSLREWIQTLPPMDTQLPESGAWMSTDLLLSPLGDTHDVFSAALRSHHSDDRLLRHDIQGNVAWTELPQDVISSDQMTEGQQAVHEARERRGQQVHDPKYMKRRRQQLASYFQCKYGYPKEKLDQFLQWAENMEQNARDFSNLCSMDV